jgi:Family of unknown function (DUF6519)
MKADFTRDTLHPFKHFTRVLMQQGRVQLDADWNEQSAILTRYLRALGLDLIGRCGGPSDNLGYRAFVLSPDPLNPVSFDFAISSGHFFVDGILCENSQDSAAFVIPQSLQNNTFTITPDRPELDGTLAQVADYLELYDATNGANSVAATVTKISGRAITVTAATTSMSGWGAPRVRRLLTYSRQPDLPMAKSDLGGQTQTPRLLVYLDVWERLVTCVEDDSIREVALGGPDTAARAKLVTQVKWTTPPPAGGDSKQLGSFVNYLENKFQPRNRGLLKARVTPSAASTDPCIISPDSGYRGPENQLYRVEIHTGILNPDGSQGTAPPTFTWSRENGAPVFPILSGGGTNVVTLETLGRDDRFGLTEGDWVEVEDDDYVLLNRAGTLLQVQSIDRSTMQVTLSGSPDANVGNKPEKHPLLRRWDQQEGDEASGGLQLGPDKAALISPGLWFNLEDGVQILFFEPDANSPVAQYRTGDYWLIPARVATGNVEWPTVVTKDGKGSPVTDQVPLPPLGVTHHYAPLANIVVDPKGPVMVSASPPSFPPAVKPTWP